MDYAHVPNFILLSNSIKIISVFQRRHGEIVHINFVIQKLDAQTDKNSTFLVRRAGG